MKISLLILIFFTARVDAFCQLSVEKPAANDVEKFGYKGCVKSVKEITYEIDTSKGKIRKERRLFNSNHDDSELDKEMFFDKSGKLSRSRLYYFDKKEILNSNTEYSYRKDGRISQINYKGWGTSKTICEYSENTIIEKCFTLEAGEKNPAYYSLSHCDSAGHLAKLSVFYAGGQLDFEEVYSRDSFGRLTEDLLRDSKKIKSVFRYSYDEQNRKKVVIRYLNDTLQPPISCSFETYNEIGKIIYDSLVSVSNSITITRTKYDSKYNKIQSSTWMDGILIFDWRYEYTYDKKGNIIKEISFDHGVPNDIKERRFKYYN